jgi:DNA repair protein RadC
MDDEIQIGDQQILMKGGELFPKAFPLQALPPRETPTYRAIHHPEACTTLELFAALIGGQDQMDIAAKLLTHFNDPQDIASAYLSELTMIAGVGEVMAARLKAAFELGRRYVSPYRNAVQIQSPKDAADVLIPIMRNYQQERLIVLLLNTRNRLIGDPTEIYRGSLNSTGVRISEIFIPAVRANAASLLLSHNHPSTDPCPSPEDVAFTKSVVEAGKLLGIDILDHIIVGGSGFISLKEKGLGFD